MLFPECRICTNIRAMDANLPTPASEAEQELRAIAIDIEGVTIDDVQHDEYNHDPTAVFDHRRSRSRSADAPRETNDQGRVLTANQIGNPYGAEEDEVCGVCLENPGVGHMVALWCCRNVLCLSDAQKIGSCPFCREEPLMWNIKK